MSWRSHTGLAVRAMVRADLAAIGFLMFVLLVIALAIDLAKWLPSVQSRAAATDTPLWQVLLPYIGFRSIDIITRLLTMACVAGGFAVTLLRHQRLEDIVIATAGGGPTLRIAALCLSGLLLGGVQLSGEAWLRPLAVERQVRDNLGDYGQRYHTVDMGTQWLADDTRALRADLTRGATPTLQNVMIFDGINQPTLTRVLSAHSATPSGQPGVWSLHKVTLWDGDIGVPEQHDQLDLPLPISTASLRWFGVDAYYLPNAAARTIAAQPNAPNTADAATALAVRKTAFFLPAIFALLGVSLASLGARGRRLSPFRLLALAAVGYLCVVSVKVFWALGIHGTVSPLIAATVPALCALLLAVTIQLIQSGHLRRPPTLAVPRTTS
ncbi:hypothetical protein NBRC116594_19270 [Shimia sp. NS0008-38b]|uniref:LptF/LptG family permease n=1 Tax=Shimia sp. NS0008-38b TaxID=3127653 RepID=UPI00310A102D